MGSVVIAALACLASFGLGYAARPRLSRRLADLELARAHALVAALRNDIAELPAAIYATESPRTQRY